MNITTDNIPDALKAFEETKRTARRLIGKLLSEIARDPKAIKAWHRSLKWQSISAKAMVNGLVWFSGDHPHRQITIKDNEISFSIGRAHFSLSLDLFTGTAEEIKAGLIDHWTALYGNEKEEEAQKCYRNFLALKTRFDNAKGFDKKAKEAHDKLVKQDAEAAKKL